MKCVRRIEVIIFISLTDITAFELSRKLRSVLRHALGHISMAMASPCHRNTIIIISFTGFRIRARFYIFVIVRDTALGLVMKEPTEVLNISRSRGRQAHRCFATLHYALLITNSDITRRRAGEIIEAG